MILRHLCFTSPVQEHALVEFNEGLNLIYGASNTGKSSIVDGIDFMLGREKKLKELPEHDEFESVLLGLEFSDTEKFTLFRSIRGGNYLCYEGLHQKKPEDVEFETLKAGKSTKKINSVSDFLMEKIELVNKKLKKNAKNETENLTIRTLLPLFLITETDIQKELSPFRTKQYTKETVERSRLKLILTGIDDSSLVSNKALEKIALSHSVRVEVLDELILEQKHLIEESDDRENTLEDLLAQKANLDETLNRERRLISETEAIYRDAANSHNDARQKLRRSNERSSEITEMLSRFSLLDEHYAVDLLRLNSVAEAGSLLAALPDNDCPLCGAKKEAHNLDHDCDGNIEEVVEAARAEISKILRLKEDLKVAVTQLKLEESHLASNIPSLERALQTLSQTLQEISPSVTQARTSFSQYLEEKTEVEKSIHQFETLSELEGRRTKVVEEKSEPSESETKQDTTLSTSAMDELSTHVKSMLDLWGVPNVDRVHYSSESDDFVFNGKNRISNGKGHRSITHAAITIAMCKYLESKGLPSLGFVILDSPLLAYEEPDNAEDDLSATDVNLKFFDSLIDWNTTQTIVIENKKSVPKKMEDHERSLFFTKNSELDRYGFFPINSVL